MPPFGREIAVAFRSLRKSPSFTIAAVVTLALGISSTTAIFSVVESVLLEPLPFPSADRIVVPQSVRISGGGGWSITYADFMDWRDNGVFAKVAALRTSHTPNARGRRAPRSPSCSWSAPAWRSGASNGCVRSIPAWTRVMS